jgi:hypothetical protein
MSKDIKPYNNKGLPHGYWEMYSWYNGKLWHKSFYHNGKRVGYEENNYNSGRISKKRYNL